MANLRKKGAIGRLLCDNFLKSGNITVAKVFMPNCEGNTIVIINPFSRENHFILSYAGDPGED